MLKVYEKIFPKFHYYQNLDEGQNICWTGETSMLSLKLKATPRYADLSKLWVNATQPPAGGGQEGCQGLGHFAAPVEYHWTPKGAGVGRQLKPRLTTIP